jgi:DNA-binding CsgD family transcriptional regulator
VTDPPSTVDLLERDRELARLEAECDEALAGHGGLVVIEGPAGIGKSRLLAAAREMARERGARVLGARGSELEREFPYGVVRQLFEPPLAEADERERMLAGAGARAQSVFESVDEAAAGAAQGDSSFASLHALYWLAVNLSERSPLMLAIDDAHWCDGASLRFLAYLARRLEGMPVLVAITLRPAEPGADAAMIGEISNEPIAGFVRPGALSGSAVATILGERLGEHEQSFTDACHAATGGNPLLVRELLRAVETEGIDSTAARADFVRELGSRAVSRTVLLRLARLPGESQDVARATAVLGDGADLPTVAALAGIEQEAAAQATGELVRAEILMPDLPLAFTHGLVRGAVYNDLPPGERELMHDRAARLRREAGAPAEQIAAQLLAIPRRGEPWIAESLRSAARSALAQGAAESAVAYLGRALEEPSSDADHTALQLELGLAEALTSGSAAAEHLLAAHDAAGDAIARGMITVALARLLAFTGRPQEAAALAERAAAELGPEQLDLRQQLEACRLNAAVLFPRVDPGTLEQMKANAEPGEGDGAGARMLTALAAYAMLLAGDPAERCADAAMRAVEDGRLVEADNGGGPHVAAILALALADREEARSVCDEAIADAHRCGSVFALSAGHIFRGLVLLRRGELADAEEDVSAGFEALDLWGIEMRPIPAAFLAEILVERGDAAGARAALERARLPEETPVLPTLNWWHAARIRVLMLEDRTDEALARAEECAMALAESTPNPAWLPSGLLRAEALGRLGRREEALAAAEAELVLARRFGGPQTLGRSLRVLGALEGEEGIERLGEAVGLLERSPARLEHAKVLLALGTARRLARRPSDAREPLRRALEIGAVCGAEPLVEAARAELRATGARPRTDALSGVEALTPSELRVAGMAASGKTNREIAQELYVTPRTVEVHLTNTYRKLEIGSRHDLAAALTPA